MVCFMVHHVYLLRNYLKDTTNVHNDEETGEFNDQNTDEGTGTCILNTDCTEFLYPIYVIVHHFEYYSG